jgi:NAD(P)-dependent dehydrogenase (short-subunit alcohol dehydrogenase family)
MQGKVAVVCGGSRGLGRAVALELARRGASVATCARSAGDLARIRSELFAEGVPAVAEICDLRNEGETREFLDLVTTTLGAIDILVTNAATINVGPVETQTTSDFHDALTSTFDTALNPTLAVLPSMQRRRRGTIAFVTSIGGKIGVPHLAPYSAAKFATVGFANALRAEIAKDGVHVLTIVPGLMRTGSHLRATFQGDPEKELAWFGASATTPGISIDADVAARRIVRAILRGDDEIVFTLPARIASRTHDLLPALWSFAMSIVGRLLPRPAMGAAILREEGRTVADRPSSKLVGLVRARGRKLAVRHNELAPRA